MRRRIYHVVSIMHQPGSSQQHPIRAKLLKQSQNSLERSMRKTSNRLWDRDWQVHLPNTGSRSFKLSVALLGSLHPQHYASQCIKCFIILFLKNNLTNRVGFYLIVWVRRTVYHETIVISVGLLFTYDPPAATGREGKPRRQGLVTRGRTFHQMLYTLLHEVSLTFHQMLYTLLREVSLTFHQMLYTRYMRWV